MLPDSRSQSLVLFLAVVGVFVAGVLVAEQQSASDPQPLPDKLVSDVLSERSLPGGDTSLEPQAARALPAPKWRVLPAAPRPTNLLFPMDVERAMLIEGREGLEDNPQWQESDFRPPRF
ncbi:hypothetical protein NG895_02665 [Aeoliella sp. ICT_H6.2]|uniref:Uncharacterized protein n=1 Tax=Aeoliella straminimaris TaxID=2954799 RepID=A0A9X2F5V8_9BACT|nr:hypothetical protein [Aeoliella straminimaris]MCO6042800.1 hypothetical protein [Aeoliella straminimaris]